MGLSLTNNAFNCHVPDFLVTTMNFIVNLTVLLLMINCHDAQEFSNTKQQALKALASLEQKPLIISRNGGFRFEDEQSTGLDFSNLDSSEHAGQPFRFEESQPGVSENPGRVVFQDDISINQGDYYSGQIETTNQLTFQEDKTKELSLKKKRRRRRRKPRYQQALGQPNFGAIPNGGQYPGIPYPIGGAGYPGYPAQLYPGVDPSGRPVGQYYRPPRRPKPSFASEALSAVTGALSSIAQYDDYQCVPRLLCEAAGGGALGSSPLLQSIAGLQPLLTILSAYNGISTSPLFVFGRAVFLGMTSKGNTASCRYAYPQCPTDPEQLVHYLNNHNGGFFRFFNSPQSQNPQNIEQFYNQLSGQYGLYQPSLGQQNYGVYNPHLNYAGQQYGIYQPQAGTQNYGFDTAVNQPYPGIPNIFHQYNQNFGIGPSNPQLNSQLNNYGLYNNKYSNGPNNNVYANNFKYNQYNGKKYGIYKDNSGKANQIEKRIQNKPNYIYVDNSVGEVDINSKWIFPEKNNNGVEINNVNIRESKTLKFPEENVNINNDPSNVRETKSLVFPEKISPSYVNYYKYTALGNTNEKYGFYQNNNVNGYDKKYGYNAYYTNNLSNRYNIDDGVQTVYVVRGNGDPNNPEIFKVRPGEKLML